MDNSFHTQKASPNAVSPLSPRSRNASITEEKQDKEILENGKLRNTSPPQSPANIAKEETEPASQNMEESAPMATGDLASEPPDKET